MATTDEIFNYVMTNPYNTNPNQLRTMLDSVSSGNDNIEIINGIVTSYLPADEYNPYDIYYCKMEGEDSPGERYTELSNKQLEGKVIIFNIKCYVAEGGAIDPTGTGTLVGFYQLFPVSHRKWATIYVNPTDEENIAQYLLSGSSTIWSMTQTTDVA